MESEYEKQEQLLSKTDSENESRRKFLKTAGTAAAVAPAVSLLLSASSTTVNAQELYGRISKKQATKKTTTKKVATKK